jgi:hypothetical protein
MKRLFLAAAQVARLASITVLFAPAAVAQLTLEYTDGETNATAYSLSPPNDPLTLQIGIGTAIQSGALTGSGELIKAGAGSLSSPARTRSPARSH